ncbi:GDP dissociation inhibitor [Rhizoctonia solani 123E]|uniref:GDP dissociation inhibitor n=1 Tax=Rhizoctonia solani 123E TaxID=1423351 RepID=A0A074RVU4_9AGAM|nr:GDP dissociation inhibitor [Rhizoctonia solani 123E]
MQDELQESHYDAVVIGTGLTQSIVAGALAAANKPIIHIDESESYGGPHASLALSELSSFDPAFHPSLVSRQYSISLTPHLIPATGPFIAALVNSGVSRYGSFVLPKRVVVCTQEGFKNVPANKQDVFKDKTIGLVQKRRLIKFLMFATGDFENSSELNGKETAPLLEFVRDVFGIDKELAEALSYAVAFCVDAKDQTLPGLLRTRTYLRSVGRYGPSPFLIGHYGGSGELAQGFCRTCAVGGGTYVLGRKVVSITRHDEKNATHRSLTTSSGKTFTSYHPPSTFESYGVEGVQVSAEESGAQVQPEDESSKDDSTAQTEEPQPSTPTGPYFRVQLEGFAAPFTSRRVIGPEKWLASILDTSNPPDKPKLSNTIRAVLITDAPTTFAPPASDQPVSSDDQSTGETKLDESIIVFPSEEGAVSVLVNGASTMSCPDGKCILYFAAQSSQDPKEFFAKYISAVLDACSPKPEIWGEVYWREREIDKVIVRHADESQQPPPREEEKYAYSTTHFTEGADAATREAERVFWDALGDQPGEDGKGKDGVEFFARIQREDDLFDD